MLSAFLLIGTALSLNVYPSQYESYSWDLQVLFDYPEDPYYTLIDDSINFQIKEPFQTNNQPRSHVQQADTLISARAKMSNQGNFWMFNFIFIDSNGKSVNLYNAKSEQDSPYTPYFNVVIPVVSNDDTITCYDTDFVTSDLYIVDCSRYLGPGYVDQLIILNQGEIKTYEQSTTRTTPLNSRILKTCIISENAFALRGESQSPSYIQIYKLNYDNTPTYGALIDSKLLQEWFNLGLSYQFQLVDFIVNFKNEFYILDKAYLFLLSIQIDGSITPISVQARFTNIPIAFDWNYFIDDMDNFIEVQVILFNNEFIKTQTRSPEKKVSLPFQCGSDARIKISEEFIVISSNGMEYLYSLFHHNMIYKMELQGQIPLFNPQVPKFITISQTQTNLYYISNGLLYLQSPQNTVNQKTVSVQAISNGQLLERAMNYSIIQQNDEALYQVRDVDFFKGPISDMNDFTYIQPCWSGPNMRYSSVKQEFQFYQSMPLNIEANSYAPDSLRYASILQIDQDKLYMIFQLRTLEINILNCTRGEQELFDNCKEEFRITDYITFLSDQTFQWWSFQDDDLVNDKVNLAWVEQDNNVTIIQQTGIIYTNQIDLPHQCSVKQILYLQNFLLVLCPAQIFVYDETLNYKLVQTIDQTLMQKLGYKDSWNPNQIFGNWKAYGNYLIIQNNNQLLITKYIFTLALLHRINLPEVGAEIKIALNSDTFFVVSQGQKEYIVEYSLNEQIGLLKQLPLFHYQLQKPLDITYSLDSGLLFVSATYNGDRFYTLVYQPGVLAHDSLLQTMELQDPGFIQAAGGDQQDTYYYYNNGDKQSEKVIFKNTIAQSQIQIKSNKYFNTYLAELIILNDVSYHQVYESIDLINTMSTIFMDASALKDLEIDQMNTYDQVNLNSNWYMGQVTTFALDCKICGNNVKLLNPINKINSKAFLNYTINFISYFDERYNLFVDQYKLLLVNLDNNIGNQLILDQQYNCLQAKATPNKQYILAFCKVNYVLYAILIKSQDYELKQFKNAQYLKEINSISKFQFLNNNLLILQSGVEVFVYNLVYDQNSWNLEQQQQLSALAEDFDSIVTRLNMYIISILEYDILIIYQCDQISEHLNIQYKTIIDIRQQLDSLNMYYTTKTHFQLCHFHDHLQNDNQHDIQLQILIVSDNVAHYLFNFWLNQQSLVESSIISILNQYGDWGAQKVAAYYNSYIALVYSKNGQRLLVVYHLFDHEKQTITFLGGIKQNAPTYVAQKIPLVIFMYPKQQVINNELSNQLTHLYSNFQEYDQRYDVISTYQIYQSPQLAFIGGLQIDHSTQVQITGLNDFSNYTIQLTIQEVIDNTATRTSAFWLIFLLSALVILAFLMTIFVCRRRGMLQGQSQDTIARQSRQQQQSDGEQQLLNNI